MSKFIEANSKGQTYIDNQYLYDNRLTSTEKTVYAVLCSACYADKYETTVGQLTVAKAISKSIRTVQRAIKKLKELGYILVKRRGSISNITIIVSKQMRKIGERVINSTKKAYNQSKASRINKKSTFNNFKQRNYNFKNLKEMLLGRKEYNAENLYQLE